ncbi:MAG: ankyrin repeat domain-containing protein, partial [Phycisphaeraceae bacterium]
MTRSRGRSAFIGAAIACALLAAPAPAPAHETDNYTLPREQQFADLGPLFTEIFYRNLHRAVEHVNARIRAAERSGASAQQLDELRSPDTIAQAVRDAFPHTLSLIDDVNRMLAREQARRRYPGQLIAHKPFEYIYSYSSFILDPRQVFKLWRSPTVRIDDTYMGTDKLGHFLAKGHINYKRYRSRLADGGTRAEAIDHAIAIGIGGDFFYSEKRMVGYFSSGVLSNGDLAADYLGMKFYMNLTEPVMLRGEQRPPMVRLRGGYLQLADHVQPDSDFFTVYMSDHLNEALNPNVMEPMMRRAVQRQIAKHAPALLARYSDRFGNRRSRLWFERKFRELSTYYGEEYGHESKFDDMITIANSCFPSHRFADVHDRSPLGRTVLHQLAADGHFLLIDKVIAEGADVNAAVYSQEPYSSEWGNRPLHYAARGGYADIVRTLLASGADVNAANLRGVTPLHRAAQVGGRCAELLLDAGADVNAADETRRTPLHWAATYPRAGTVRRLIEAGADVQAVDHEGCTPLHYAAKWGQAEVIDALLEAGASLDARANYGVTPLHRAAIAGQANAAARLLDAGAPVNATSETRRTALHAAAMHGHTPVAQVLLTHDADANARDVFDQTPLHEAARRNNTHLARVLIDAGAEIDHADRFDHTPLQ